MEYKTILVNKTAGEIAITINRPDQRNSINAELLIEINHVLDTAEQDDQCRVIVLKGQKGIFCTGMDFNTVAKKQEQNDFIPVTQNNEHGSNSRPYLETLKRFSLIPKIVITLVDGLVVAGGVGLVAASDIAIATPASNFSLSEALWGLLPSMVLPFLIRRVGFQTAYRMTLTTMPVNAKTACETHLIDEINENLQEAMRAYFLRVSKLEGSTIRTLKDYFRKLWIITNQMEDMAVSQTDRLSSDPGVINNIINYVKYQKFPWED
ncbi:MAG: enoyl-CoA hydratase/isomerase family protein [Spirochaetales bacterium]|nr:enoyl-CoA hydratase/isomerase family protein [Spirochaetales bacterium]